MFDLDRFIADCRAALVADATHKSVREIVLRAVSDPGALTLDGQTRDAAPSLGGVSTYVSGKRPASKLFKLL